MATVTVTDLSGETTSTEIAGPVDVRQGDGALHIMGRSRSLVVYEREAKTIEIVEHESDRYERDIEQRLARVERELGAVMSSHRAYAAFDEKADRPEQGDGCDEPRRRRLFSRG
jgi:hypothetical protein